MTAIEQAQQQLVAQPRRWLVTGSAGFIGSHLVEALLRLGPDGRRASTTSRPATAATSTRCRRSVGAGAWRRHRFIEGDIRDAATCRDACDGVDVVLHQAALGSVPRSIEDPLATNAANVDGFLNMLVAARDAGVARFVYAASSSTYGDHPRLPKVEDAHRPAAVAVRGDQVRQRALRRRLRALLRTCRRSACATSTCSARARIPKARTPR